MMRQRKRFGLALCVLGGLATTGCPDDQGSGITPAITVENQTLTQPNQVTIKSVTSDGPGWILIHEAAAGGGAGEALGALSVPKGTSANQAVTLSASAKDGQTLWARVAQDAGAIAGQYEPNLDTPFKIDGKIVEASFVVTVTTAVVTPKVTVENQRLSDPKQVVIKEVVSDGKGLVVVHEHDAASDTYSGVAVGVAGVQSGTTEDLVVALDRAALDGEVLHAMLHKDVNGDGAYDAATDIPVTAADQVVVQAFEVTVPGIEVEDQTLAKANQVTVKKVVSGGKGLVIIHVDSATTPGTFGADAIGVAAVAAGESTGVTVDLSRDAKDGETLHAMLHVDDNGDGQYDSQKDVEVTVGGEIVVEMFKVTVTAAPPSAAITALDQQVDKAVWNVVEIAEATLTGQGFLVIHEDDGSGTALVPGSAAKGIGVVALPSGKSSNVMVTLDRDIVHGEWLHAMLHVDAVADGGAYDAAKDAAMLGAGGNLVVLPFLASYPPLVVVDDQNLATKNQVVIERAVSDGKGFLVVHEESKITAGQPGDGLGTAPLADGVNLDVKVTLARDIVEGETLWAMLHVDTDGDGTYTDAQADPPVIDDDGVIMPTFTVSALEPGIEVAAVQKLTDAAKVMVAKVTASAPSYVVIHKSNAAGDSFSGEQLGSAAVAKGETKDLVVTLTAAATEGQVVWAMLHVDADPADGAYDPGKDVPTLDAGAMIVVPTELTFLDEGSLALAEYTATDVSSILEIGTVVAPEAGFVVVHEDAGGGAGSTVLGSMKVAAGTTAEVTIELDRPLADGETVWPMLHKDANTQDGDYQGEVTDPPVFDYDDAVVVGPMKVKVPTGTPAAIVVMDGTNFEWKLSSVTPASWKASVGGSSTFPTLTLVKGWRYEVVTLQASTHPLALGQDTAGVWAATALAQKGTVGILESDLTVAWDDLGSGKARFTASTALVSAVNAYRCDVHTDMKGSVAFVDP